MSMRRRTVLTAPAIYIAIWAIATVPQAVVNVAFTMVMSAVAGPNQRYYLMSRRWSMSSCPRGAVGISFSPLVPT